MNFSGITDTTGTDMSGCKYDIGKLRLDLLPFDALEEVGRVLTTGADKYGDRNWERGMAWSRLLGAALRHLFSWAMRSGRDAESGRSQLAHAAADILFLLAYEIRGIGEDDRVGG